MILKTGMSLLALIFARKLLDALDLKDIEVESTEMGDHYDPISKTVRLTEDKMNSGSPNIDCCSCT